jgi:hypothetical protein
MNNRETTSYVALCKQDALGEGFLSVQGKVIQVSLHFCTLKPTDI